jgi:hypothetical protein
VWRAIRDAYLIEIHGGSPGQPDLPRRVAGAAGR